MSETKLRYGTTAHKLEPSNPACCLLLIITYLNQARADWNIPNHTKDCTGLPGPERRTMHGHHASGLFTIGTNIEHNLYDKHGLEGRNLYAPHNEHLNPQMKTLTTPTLSPAESKTHALLRLRHPPQHSQGQNLESTMEGNAARAGATPVSTQGSNPKSCSST